MSVNQLQKNLEEARAQAFKYFNLYVTKMSDKNRENDILRRSLTKKRRNNRSLKRSLTKKRRRNKILKEMVNGSVSAKLLLDTIDKARCTKDTLNLAIEDKEEILSMLQDRIDSLEDRIDRKDNNIYHLRKGMDDRDRTIASLRSIINDPIVGGDEVRSQ